MHPANIQINLYIRAVWPESSLSAFWIVKDAQFLYVDNKEWSDWLNAQAYLNLCSVHISEGTFSHVE